MTNKEYYARFCRDETNLPVFLTDWWLDAVCGHNYWDVVLSRNGNEIFGVLPYFYPRKGYILVPGLTPFLGPYIIYPEGQKYPTRISYELNILDDLYGQLPDFVYYNQKFSPFVTNWLPFYWKGFQQTTRYTYVLTDIANHEAIWKGFQGRIKRNIRKAHKTVKVLYDMDIDKFLKINALSFLRQNRGLPYDKELVYSIEKACGQRDQRKIFYAEDMNGRIHAAIYVIWDNSTAYYLMGGADPELRNSGAQALLLWKAIKYTSKLVEHFDFEGSMMKSIERFFRDFGGRQVPFFHIIKDKRSKLRKFADRRGLL
jgi:hypothetical protein